MTIEKLYNRVCQISKNIYLNIRIDGPINKKMFKTSTFLGNYFAATLFILIKKKNFLI